MRRFAFVLALFLACAAGCRTDDRAAPAPPVPPPPLPRPVPVPPADLSCRVEISARPEGATYVGEGQGATVEEAIARAQSEACARLREVAPLPCPDRLRVVEVSKSTSSTYRSENGVLVRSATASLALAPHVILEGEGRAPLLDEACRRAALAARASRPEGRDCGRTRRCRLLSVNGVSLEGGLFAAGRALPLADPAALRREAEGAR